MAESAAVLEEVWQTYRPQINAALERSLDGMADCPPRLHEAMTYSLLAGGKRLRPLLVLLACETCGGSPEAAMPAACAVEMVHTYSLIHDDLPAMDDDELRRGRATNHMVYGEAMAILAGDALLTRAFEIVAADVQPPQVAAACCADLARAAGMCGMVGGQVADLEAEKSPSANLEELEAVHRRKTGCLLASSLMLGARVAQAEESSVSALAEYGRCLGLAFQITDDLLDISGNVEKMGKGVQKDAGMGKLTYPAVLGVESSEARSRDMVAEACRALEPFGDRGRRLEALAYFVLERDH